MKDSINVIVIRVGESPRRDMIRNTLEDLQAFVGGYIEAVPVDDGVYAICDEEGRLKGKPMNCYINGIDFFGDILICGVDGEDFGDLPDNWEVSEC
jgi:hypothetical protein